MGCVWHGAKLTFVPKEFDMLWAGDAPNAPGEDERLAFAYLELVAIAHVL